MFRFMFFSTRVLVGAQVSSLLKTMRSNTKTELIFFESEELGSC